ncbi:MAG: multidrug efflux SMR transporter [Burkholderiaceae bacterium]|jgi:quaternary ammonium compound-resistance protein SugE|nr:multidrug efflux SMR transporter [Burkholderiaceae bacterium]
MSSWLNPSTAQAWILLTIAGVLETGWAVGMKYTDGFKHPVATAFVVAVALASFWLLALAMRALPVGTAYAVWVGIGAAGAALLGIALFGEPASFARLACVALIVAGVIGLKLVSD